MKVASTPEPFAIKTLKGEKVVSNQIIFANSKEKLPTKDPSQSITPLTSKAKKIYAEWIVSQSKAA